jgi:hypothetical protein
VIETDRGMRSGPDILRKGMTEMREEVRFGC